MVTTTEKVKYTPELVSTLTKLHVEQKLTSKQIAEQLGLPERSVRGKLIALGIYEKIGYKNKQGETPVRKEEYVERIALALGIDPEMCESLTKVNKFILKTLDEALGK